MQRSQPQKPEHTASSNGQQQAPTRQAVQQKGHSHPLEAVTTTATAEEHRQLRRTLREELLSIQATAPQQLSFLNSVLPQEQKW